MNSEKRTTVIAGNWKMNMTASQCRELIGKLKETLPEAPACKVIICVPYTDLTAAVELCAGTAIHVGAQNLHFKDNGAFTGEISAPMLNDLNVEYVIIGHSERRQYFAETDATVNLKLKAALAHSIKPIVCLGEVLEERDNGITDEVIARQTKLALLDIPAEQVSGIIFAYEPVWAIGTGRTATADQANETCGVIRSVIAAKYGDEIAQSVTVQYGGSMNAGNAAELLSMEHVDGGLIGGASLKPNDFAVIVNAAK